MDIRLWLKTNILFTLVLLPTSAFSAWQYGAGVESGYTILTSSRDEQLDQNGDALAAYAGIAFWPNAYGVLTTVLGVQSFTLAGENLDQEQSIEVRTALLNISYRWRWRSVEGGFLLRGNSGKGASLAVEDQNLKKNVFSIGPEFAYRWEPKLSDVLLYVAANWETNVPKQTNATYSTGLQFWLGEKARPEAMKSPKVKTFIFRLKADLFKFASNSSELKGSSLTTAREIGMILRKNLDQWTRMEIVGHSDSASKNPSRNHEVSELRARAVLKVFEEAGIATERLEVNGVSATSLLPGLPGDAPENRRAEVTVYGVINARLGKALYKYVEIKKER